MSKDGALTGQALADYQQAWNKANGANSDYSNAMAAGQPAGGSVPVLRAPQGYVGPSAGANGVYGAPQAPAQSYSQPYVGGGGAAMFGGATGASGVGFSAPSVSGGSISAPNITNTAQTDPNLTDYLNQIKARTQGSGTLPANLQLLAQGAGQMAEGARNQLGSSLARRGMLGNSGAQEALGSEISNNAIGQYTRAGKEAVLGREGQIDSLLGGSAAAFAEPARQALAEKGFNLAQWQAGTNATLAQQDMSLRAQVAAQQAQAQQAALANQQLQAMTSLYSNLYY